MRKNQNRLARRHFLKTSVAAFAGVMIVRGTLLREVVKLLPAKESTLPASVSEAGVL